MGFQESPFSVPEQERPSSQPNLNQHLDRTKKSHFNLTNLIAGICFWREGSDGVAGPDRRGAGAHPGFSESVSAGSSSPPADSRILRNLVGPRHRTGSRRHFPQPPGHPNGTTFQQNEFRSFATSLRIPGTAFSASASSSYSRINHPWYLASRRILRSLGRSTGSFSFAPFLLSDIFI